MRLNRALAALPALGGLLSALALVPFSTAPAQAQAPASTTMVVATLQDADTLNPFLGTSATSTQIFRLSYDYLTDYNPADNTPVPALATSWTTSDQGLTWTFPIRSGVTWSDGVPLTAEDIRFTYRTLLDHPALANSALIRNVADVSAPDPHTLVIRTKVPTPGMLALDIPIVPEHIWAGLDPAKGPPGDRMWVGSGPFVLHEARPGAYYRLTRRAGYWRGSPGIDQLVLRYFTNGDAAVQALRKGDVDAMSNLTPAEYTALAGDPRITRNEARRTRFTELGFNPGAARADGKPIGNGHPALADPVVRRAIDQAIDRNVLVSRVLAGQGDVGSGYLPASVKPWGWRPDAAQLRRYDPAAANRALDAAGYRRGADGTRRMPGGGRKLEFTVLVPTSRAHYQQTARYLTGWLAAIGIDLKTTLLSDTEKSARVSTGRYDMFLGGWILDPDPDFLLSVQTCAARPDSDGTGTTDTFLCDRRYDELFNLQSREINPIRRAQLVDQMQQQLYNDAGLLTLYYPAVLEAYRSDRFTGLIRRPADGGSLIGPWSLAVARPIQSASTAQPQNKPNVAGFAGMGLVIALAAAVAGGLWWSRATRDQRE